MRELHTTYESAQVREFAGRRVEFAHLDFDDVGPSAHWRRGGPVAAPWRPAQEEVAALRERLMFAL
jgi:hypothetical protein